MKCALVGSPQLHCLLANMLLTKSTTTSSSTVKLVLQQFSFLTQTLAARWQPPNLHMSHSTDELVAAEKHWEKLLCLGLVFFILCDQKHASRAQLKDCKFEDELKEPL